MKNYKLTYSSRNFVEETEKKETHVVNTLKRAFELAKLLYGKEASNFVFSEKHNMYSCGNYTGWETETCFIEEYIEVEV